MRTTIDLDRAQRRGSAAAQERLRKRALTLRGKFSKAEAESLRRHVAALRGSPNSVSPI